ncbi:hypothetical protein C8J56DRAFT_1049967 [Mycena floridula]|nr:hypothetical protein C8J56DRAFT_1049967 [Mycena floridula]
MLPLPPGHHQTPRGAKTRARAQRQLQTVLTPPQNSPVSVLPSRPSHIVILSAIGAVDGSPLTSISSSTRSPTSSARRPSHSLNSSPTRPSVTSRKSANVKISPTRVAQSLRPEYLKGLPEPNENVVLTAELLRPIWLVADYAASNGVIYEWTNQEEALVEWTYPAKVIQLHDENHQIIGLTYVPVPPQELDQYADEHDIDWPSCLCAMLCQAQDDFTPCKVQVGGPHAAVLKNKHAFTCRQWNAQHRCKYWIVITDIIEKHGTGMELAIYPKKGLSMSNVLLPCSSLYVRVKAAIKYVKSWTSYEEDLSQSGHSKGAVPEPQTPPSQFLTQDLLDLQINFFWPGPRPSIKDERVQQTNPKKARSRSSSGSSDEVEITGFYHSPTLRRRSPSLEIVSENIRLEPSRTRPVVRTKAEKGRLNPSFLPEAPSPFKPSSRKKPKVERPVAGPSHPVAGPSRPIAVPPKKGYHNAFSKVTDKNKAAYGAALMVMEPATHTGGRGISPERFEGLYRLCAGCNRVFMFEAIQSHQCPHA